MLARPLQRSNSFLSASSLLKPLLRPKSMACISIELNVRLSEPVTLPIGWLTKLRLMAIQSGRPSMSPKLAASRKPLGDSINFSGFAGLA